MYISGTQTGISNKCRIAEGVVTNLTVVVMILYA